MDICSPNADFSNEPSPLDGSLISQIEEFWFHVFLSYDCTDIRGIMVDDDSIVSLKYLQLF